MDFLDDYADLIVSKIFILNALFEGTAGFLIMLLPSAVFTRVGGHDGAKAVARFYGAIMFVISLATVLFSKLPDDNPGKLVMGAVWLVFHAAAAFYLTVPILGRVADGFPSASAAFGHVLFSALWAYYLFVEHEALPLLKSLIPTQL